MWDIWMPKEILMFANEKLPDQDYGFKTLLIDYFNQNNGKQSFCSAVSISVRICLLQHLTHTDFHRGRTYPSCGMRTRALGRSSTEELTMVSRKSPSGWATWLKQKKRGSKKANMDLSSLKGPHCQVSCSAAPVYGHVCLWPPPLQTDLENLPLTPVKMSCSLLWLMWQFSQGLTEEQAPPVPLFPEHGDDLHKVLKCVYLFYLPTLPHAPINNGSTLSTEQILNVRALQLRVSISAPMISATLVFSRFSKPDILLSILAISPLGTVLYSLIKSYLSFKTHLQAFVLC